MNGRVTTFERADLTETVDRFLAFEASILDAADFGAWLELWSSTALYWIPCGDEPEPGMQVSIVRDDAVRLAQRVRRLQSRFNWTRNPPVRVSRIVTNASIDSVGGDEVLAVTSKFIASVYDSLTRETRTYAGSYFHELSPGGTDSFRINQKHVRLIDADGPHEKLSFIL